MAERISKPDRLQSPEAPWRIILMVVAGGLGCLLVSVIALGVYYRILLHGGAEPVKAAPFPTPALETNLFRAAPQAPSSIGQPPGVEAAMAAVAAKGAHGYDPVGAPVSGPVSGPAGGKAAP